MLLDASARIMDNSSSRLCKRFIRKKALKRVEKLMEYAQKKPEDYTKEEMRELIEKEEKEVISTYTQTVGIGTILLMLGIPKL